MDPTWAQELKRSLDSNANLIDRVVQSLVTSHRPSDPRRRHRQPPNPSTSSHSHSISLPEARKLLISLLYPDDGSFSSFDDLAFIISQPPTTALRRSFHLVSPLDALGKLTPMRLEELEDSKSDETIKRTSQPALPPPMVRFPTTTTLPPAFHTVFETSPTPQDPQLNPPPQTHRAFQQLPELGPVPPLVLADRDALKEIAVSKEPWKSLENQLVGFHSY